MSNEFVARHGILVTGSVTVTNQFVGTLNGNANTATTAVQSISAQTASYSTNYKAGVINSSSFGGSASPWTSSVSFGNPYSNTNYAVTLTSFNIMGTLQITGTLQPSGFTASINTTSSFSGKVFWMAQSLNS